MTVLIPAYRPDQNLLELLQNLKNNFRVNIVVVDEGSGQCFDGIFTSAKNMGCTVLTHEINCGKGCALKKGFQYILTHTYEDTGVVTADADGQHLIEDIVRVAVEIPDSPEKIVLGVRKFTHNMPLRSKLGNIASRIMFEIACGVKISDSQTGLRGFPISMLPWLLKVEGDRFDYEMNMLLKAPACGYGLNQVVISTVYNKHRHISHYRPLHDSALISASLLKACLKSIPINRSRTE
jgi:glycosyltransferase involved in cell wall biosynthesis